VNYFPSWDGLVHDSTREKSCSWFVFSGGIPTFAIAYEKGSASAAFGFFRGIAHPGLAPRGSQDLAPSQEQLTCCFKDLFRGAAQSG